MKESSKVKMRFVLVKFFLSIHDLRSVNSHIFGRF